MKFRRRIYENQVINLTKFFKVILLAGARQVGKSSLLAHLFPEISTFVFDPLQDLYGAKKDPDLFLTNFKAPLILDEIQFAPELLPSIKRRVDLSDQKGQYLLTGSQQLSILKTVSESLAGRIAIIKVNPMIPQEIWAIFKPEYDWLAVYMDDPSNISKKIKGTIKNIPSLYEIMWRGGMPGTIDLPNQAIHHYFSSYIQTYVERDIRTIENIQNLTDFGRFFSLLGALTAQEINYSQLGREIGISPATAQRWLQLLIHTYQWNIVQPYHGNVIKRISEKPKGFFSDTGIACYLQRISSMEALSGHPLLGSLFESFCFSIIKSFSDIAPMQPNIYHWRAISGAEVDLILERDGMLYPIEIKCKSNLTGNDTRGIQAFNETYSHKKIAHGIIIYAGDKAYKLNEYASAIPWNSIV